MTASSSALPPPASVSHRGLRLALAGALAGMFTNTLLHPLDTVKTLRQTDPANYRGVAPALLRVVQLRGPFALYAGIAPALLGSALSSALYFGVYELAKTQLSSLAPGAFRKRRQRVPLTALSAACGNIASSVLFVPKEVVKQRMQAGLHSGRFFSAVVAVVRTSGMPGLYRGYKATLLRNIPSTMIRFALYEELKILGVKAKGGQQLKPREFVFAGALAGATSSAFTTPMDVVKTRLATGMIEPGAGIAGALKDIFQRDGVAGLFIGLRPRLIWAALFAAVGFSSYEMCKAWVMGMRTGTLGRRIARGPARTEAHLRQGNLLQIGLRTRGHAVCARRISEDTRAWNSRARLS